MRRNDRQPLLEWIDDLTTPEEEIRATLRDQARVNRRLGGYHAVEAHVEPLLRQAGEHTRRVVEIACGGADISRRLVRLARRRGRRITVIAADRNPRVLACAREWSRDYPEIAFVRADALALPFSSGAFDMALLPSFLHHLPSEDVVMALRLAARISSGCIIAADLAASSLAEPGFRLLSRLAGFSEISRHDGLCSIRQAYTPRELLDFARQAGLPNCRIYRHPWFRMTLVAGLEDSSLS